MVYWQEVYLRALSTETSVSETVVRKAREWARKERDELVWVLDYLKDDDTTRSEQVDMRRELVRVDMALVRDRELRGDTEREA